MNEGIYFIVFGSIALAVEWVMNNLGIVFGIGFFIFTAIMVAVLRANREKERRKENYRGS